VHRGSGKTRTSLLRPGNGLSGRRDGRGVWRSRHPTVAAPQRCTAL